MNAHSYTWDLVVVIGTKGPFPRLVDAVATWAAGGRRVWVQHGEGPLPASLEGAARVDREQLLVHMNEARAVVVHAGTGTIRDALSVGHVPVVVARRARFGEHVNDHQVEIALALGDRIVACEAPEDPVAFAAAIAGSAARRGVVQALPGDALRASLMERLRDVRPARRAALVWDVLARLTRGVTPRRRGSD